MLAQHDSTVVRKRLREKLRKHALLLFEWNEHRIHQEEDGMSVDLERSKFAVD